MRVSTREGGANLLFELDLHAFYIIFAENCMNMKENGVRGRTSLASPRSATEIVSFSYDLFQEITIQK